MATELKSGRFHVELEFDGKPFTAVTRAINGHTFDTIEPVLKELEEDRMALLSEAPELKQALVTDAAEKTSAEQITMLAMKAPELNSKARHLKKRSILMIAQLMIDTNMGSVEAYKEQLESEITSDFWNQQDLTALGEAVKKFRVLLFGKE